jgi:hypothetical protein
MRKLLYGFAALVIAAASASAAGANSNLTKVYNIKPMGASSQSGTITFQAMGSKTKVTIMITKERASAYEPAHIHVGGCKNPGAVKFPLTDVVHGYSVTILNVPISEATVAGTSVNIHKSAQQLNIYVACGNISHHSRA